MEHNGEVECSFLLVNLMVLKRHVTNFAACQ